jgi:lysophospholipase L1-like esterase
MRARWRVGLISLTLLPLAACGGGSGTASTASTYSVPVIVFYDENGNGVLDPTEGARLPGVTVTAAGQKATTGPDGAATLTDVPAGNQQIAVDPTSLPPYYEAKVSLNVQIPQVSHVLIPVTLPIGTNTPNTYMGFGDSITVGDGSTDGTGYLGLLQTRLAQHFGGAGMINDGIEATRSNAGAARIQASLTNNHPAFILILYGTNDWNEESCREAFPCYTIDSLRAMVEAAKASHTMPFLATILPPNTGYDARVPPERQDWVHMADVLIRDMAKQEGVVIVDLEAAFLAQPNWNDLFSDHVHPNDAGYKIMSDTFYAAITSPRATSASSRGPGDEILPPFGPDGRRMWPRFPSVIPPDLTDKGVER